jgi:hypothetical protein
MCDTSFEYDDHLPPAGTGLSWGRKAAIACRASVEVRAFFFDAGLTDWHRVSPTK